MHATTKPFHAGHVDRRVHISEKTLSYLNGEFEVEPAFGEKREESLRIAGLKTYFIKKVLIPVIYTTTKTYPVQIIYNIQLLQFQRDPVPEPSANNSTTGMPKSITLESIEAEPTSDASRAPSSTENDANATQIPIDDEHINRDIESRIFNQRLEHELFGRDRHRYGGDPVLNRSLANAFHLQRTECRGERLRQIQQRRGGASLRQIQ